MRSELLVVLISTVLSPLASAAGLEDISLPPGFSISYFATGVPNARSLSLSGEDSRILYVSTRRLSNVYACVDMDDDGQADMITTVIDNKPTPNGIAWRDGDLYVVTPTSVWHYVGVDQYALSGEAFPSPTLLYNDFPSQGSHEWRYAAFGPDGKLYVAIGADCNICKEDLPFASLQRLDLETLQVETVAEGIRNTVGFSWHPDTEQLWFTDNGRDRMGDNLPDCELNVMPDSSEDIPHFGYPYCHTEGMGDPYLRNVGPGVPIPDPDLNANRQVDCARYEAAVQALGPHVAPLGMAFYTGPTFPSKYNHSIFIALHGSWNRNEKIGYQITGVEVDENNRAVSHATFATGWLQGQTSWGRPVDVIVHPDGHLLVSVDAGGVIFSIGFNGTDGAEPGSMPSPSHDSTPVISTTTTVTTSPIPLVTVSPTFPAAPTATKTANEELASTARPPNTEPFPSITSPFPIVSQQDFLQPADTPPHTAGPQDNTSTGTRTHRSERIIFVMIAVSAILSVILSGQ